MVQNANVNCVAITDFEGHRCAKITYCVIGLAPGYKQRQSHLICKLHVSSIALCKNCIMPLVEIPDAYMKLVVVVLDCRPKAESAGSGFSCAIVEPSTRRELLIPWLRSPWCTPLLDIAKSPCIATIFAAQLQQATQLCYSTLASFDVQGICQYQAGLSICKQLGAAALLSQCTARF